MAMKKETRTSPMSALLFVLSFFQARLSVRAGRDFPAVVEGCGAHRASLMRGLSTT